MMGVSLKGLSSSVVTNGFMSNKVVSFIKNDHGAYVGKFVTTGVGLAEHNRRLKAVVKKTVKARADDVGKTG